MTYSCDPLSALIMLQFARSLYLYYAFPLHTFVSAVAAGCSDQCDVGDKAVACENKRYGEEREGEEGDQDG